MEHLSYAQFVADARKDKTKYVLIERHDHYAIVRLNDPPSLNALSAALSLQLLDAVRELAQDSRIRSVVLTGVDPAFSAGGDIRAMVQGVQPMVAESAEGATSMWRWIRYQFGGIVRTIAGTDKAFIAAVNGACGGVAMAFALACDIIIASEKARFVTAFGRIGLVPELGTSWMLTRRLGYQKVFELFVSGRPLSGEEAARLGMVNEVVPHGELMAKAVEYCRRVAKLPEHALAMSKPLLRAAADLTWEQALTMEEFAEPACFTTQAHKDAIAAFLEKRWEKE